MALFCVISANLGSFRAHCVKVHVRYLISWWVLVWILFSLVLVLCVTCSCVQREIFSRVIRGCGLTATEDFRSWMRSCILAWCLRRPCPSRGRPWCCRPDLQDSFVRTVRWRAGPNRRSKQCRSCRQSRLTTLLSGQGKCLLVAILQTLQNIEAEKFTKLAVREILQIIPAVLLITSTKLITVGQIRLTNALSCSFMQMYNFKNHLVVNQICNWLVIVYCTLLSKFLC